MKIILNILIILMTITCIKAQTIYTVTNTNDPDPFLYFENPNNPAIVGSLQWAIRKANELGVPCKIIFDIPGGGQQVIYLNYDLPILSNNYITIDGTTQNGYSYQNPQIIIDGQEIAYNGLKLFGSNYSTIKGLYFKNFQNYCIFSSNCTDLNISDNVINSPIHSTLGASAGLCFYGLSNSTIKGNILGTDNTLTDGIGDADYGLMLYTNCTNNTVGGTEINEGNIIAFNNVAGLYINGNNNRLSANLIYGNPQAINNVSAIVKQPPIIISYSNLTVTGTAQPNDIIELFGSTGSENANEFLSSTTADGSGNWTATIVNISWDYIIASATDNTGNTSSYSSAFNIEIEPIVEQWKSYTLKAQEYDSETGELYTPPMFVFDKFGNKILLEDIIIPNHSYPADLFLLHFSGEDDLSGYWFDASEGEQRRNVIIQVFKDLSVLIRGNFDSNNPYPSWNSQYNHGLINVSINAANTDIDPWIASNSPYYVSDDGTNLQYESALLYLTTGVDPLYSLSNEGGALSAVQYAHGFISINTYWTFSSNLTETTPTGVDLYTVILHEAIHMLGFGTLIMNSNPSVNNNYSVYDQFLTDVNSNNLISLDNCYKGYWNNNTILNDAIDCDVYFDDNHGFNHVVYSPEEFNGGSSLSHLYCNEQNDYLMDYVYNLIHRYPNQYEVNVLNAIGYKTTNQFGVLSDWNNITGNSLSYSNSDENIGLHQYTQYNTPEYLVSGVNDFRPFATNNYNGDVSTNYSVQASSQIVIPVDDILANDVNAEKLSCLELVFGEGSLTTSTTLFDNLTIGDEIYFTSTECYSGQILLKYRPVNNFNYKGNPTYIFINIEPLNPVTPATCNELNCNLICFGDFEDIINQNVHPLSNIVMSTFDGIHTNSPDLYTYNSSTNETYLCNGDISANTYTFPSPTSNGGFKFMGFNSKLNTEAVFFTLNRTLESNKKYLLKFIAKLQTSNPNHLIFTGSFEHPCLPPDITNTISQCDCVTGSSYTFTPHSICSIEVNSTDWIEYSFIIDGILTTDINYVILNPADNSYVFIDNVEITELSDARFTTPECMVSNEPINFVSNLNSSGTSYLWDFGDGSTSTDPNLTHTYTNYGYYCVKLTISNSCGSNTYTKQIFVNPISNCDCNTAYDIEDSEIIEGDIDWGDKTIKGDVYIKFGSSLKINENSVISFSPKGRIIVERGAVLYIGNNAILKNFCSRTMWQGIEVWGYDNQLSNFQYQGKVIIQNKAKIENAHIGILAGRRTDCDYSSYPYEISYSGGIIKTQYLSNGNLEFNNCGTAIRFIKKSNSDASANHIKACIIRCTSSLADNRYNIATPNHYTVSNNPYYAPANATGRSGYGIYSYGVRNLKIENCIFYNIELAVNSIDSRLLIQNNNTFNNHSSAIFIKNSTPSYNYSNYIVNNTFTNIKNYAIYLQAGKNDIIKKNTFNPISNSVPQSDFQKGIYLVNSSGFNIKDNTFNRILYGIQVINSQSGGGTIGYETSGNTFNACKQAVYVTSYNPALKIRCNNFYPDPSIGYFKNWYIGGTGFPNQGTYAPADHHKPAGNDFYLSSYKQIQSSLYFNYIHHTQATTIPTVGGSWIKVPNNTPKIYGGTDPSCGSGIFIPRIADYNNLTIRLNSFQAEYRNVSDNIDNGNTAGLISAISGSTSAGNLKAMLKAHSPLSDEVLENYIQSPKSNTPGLFKEVITSNLPVSDQVKTDFESKLSTMPNGIAQQLQALQGNNPAYRTLTAIKRDINDATMEKQLYQNDLVNYYFDNGQEADAIPLLEAENTTEANRTLLSYYLANDNITEASAKLSLLQTTESESYIEFNQLLLDLATDSLTPYDLDSAQIEFVRNIANSTTTSIEQSNAQAILWLLYGEEFDNSEDTVTAKSMRIKPLPTPFPLGRVGDGYEYMLSISPNPVSAQSTVWYQLPGNADNATLNIYDATGRKIKIYFLPVTGNSLLIDVTDLPNGAYTYSLSVNNVIFESRKMIVIK